ncbi:TPA: YiiX/YebB-like N1pC/P60 family cysteine hydrolase [Bacillus cereus]
MKQGDIVFLQGKSIISKAVRFFDKGKFSHVAIAMSGTHILEADFDTRVSVVPLDRSEFNIVEVIDLGLNKDERSRVVDIGRKLVGKRYDYMQIVWYIISKIFRLKGKNRFNNPNNFICSELVFTVLEEADILEEMCIKGGSRGVDMTPNQLYDFIKYISRVE